MLFIGTSTVHHDHIVSKKLRLIALTHLEAVARSSDLNSGTGSVTQKDRLGKPVESFITRLPCMVFLKETELLVPPTDWSN